MVVSSNDKELMECILGQLRDSDHVGLNTAILVAREETADRVRVVQELFVKDLIFGDVVNLVHFVPLECDLVVTNKHGMKVFNRRWKYFCALFKTSHDVANEGKTVSEGGRHGSSLDTLAKKLTFGRDSSTKTARHVISASNGTLGQLAQVMGTVRGQLLYGGHRYVVSTEWLT